MYVLWARVRSSDADSISKLGVVGIFDKSTSAHASFDEVKSSAQKEIDVRLSLIFDLLLVGSRLGTISDTAATDSGSLVDKFSCFLTLPMRTVQATGT